ncbi:MAG TPA: phosphotransferase [Chroococcales cyanobacterium]
MSTFITIEALVHKLESEYDIGSVLETEAIPLDRLRQGLAERQEKQALFYKITAAARAARYCLKPHRKSLGELDISLQCQLMAEGEAISELPIPRVHSTKAGRLYFEMGGLYWSLYDYIEADPPYCWFKKDWDARTTYAAGVALSNLHLFLKESTDPAIAGTEPICRLVEESGSQLDSILPDLPDGFRRSLDRFQTTTPLPQLTDYGDILLESLDTSVERVLAQSRDGDWEQLVHGDYHPGNLLFSRRQLQGIIDFEYVHFEDPLFDLGYAATMFCVERGEELSAVQLDVHLLNALLTGYGIVSPSERINRLLPAYMLIGSILQLQWLMDAYGETAESHRDLFTNLIKSQVYTTKMLAERRAFVTPPLEL